MYFNYIYTGGTPFTYIITTKKPIPKMRCIKVHSESGMFLLNKYNRLFDIDCIDYDNTIVGFLYENNACNFYIDLLEREVHQ